MATKAEQVEEKATYEIQEAVKNLKAVGLTESEIRRICERSLNRLRKLHE